MKSKILKRFTTLLRWFIMATGVFSLLLFILAFTRAPYDVHRWLGLHSSEYSYKPDYIIFLGGSGMPSESNLIRLYYTAHLYNTDTTSKIIIAQPIDTSVINKMMDELISKGVKQQTILIEKNGTNTREQALQIATDFAEAKNKNTVIVTSPENMLRSVLTFRKAGFKKVGGEPAFESALFIDLTYNHKKIGGRSYTPDVSYDMKLRYDFWNYLKLEITCLREFTALLYYKVNGWI